MDRTKVLQNLLRNPQVSVLIVGGGINGIGTFRDLAVNGIDVVLVDRADFCSGASAASSHMAHGGIRYLENGEFRLVREAVQERNVMLANAPHIVRPLPTTIPIFHRFSGLFNAPLKFLGLLDRPSERGSFVIKLGLLIYDAYAGARRTVPRHKFMGRAQSLQRWPELSPRIVHTATYYDGAILQPERMGVELVLDAEAANSNAWALNYIALTGFEDGAVVLTDQTNGARVVVRPRILVNATGPWIDRSNRALGMDTHFIGGTKGSHIVVNNPALRRAIGEHEFFFENRDGRIVLIFPLFDRVLIGTSDLAEEDPDSAICTAGEVGYFLELVSRVFPQIHIREEDIVFRFSGVRPLAASKSRTTGQITRDHEIQSIEPEHAGVPFPILSLVGGKWTSWRAFSEQVADSCIQRLGMRRSIDTRDLKIGGGKNFPTQPTDRDQVLQSLVRVCGSAFRAEVLLDRYGSRAGEIARFCAGAQDAALEADPEYTARELEFLARFEKIVYLDDLLLRRSMLAMLGRVTPQMLDEVARILAAPLGWDQRRVDAEIARAKRILRTRHQVDI